MSAAEDRGVQVEALPAEIVRVDRYTVVVDGLRVRADERQERALRAMTPEQQQRFLRIFGAER